MRSDLGVPNEVGRKNNNCWTQRSLLGPRGMSVTKLLLLDPSVWKLGRERGRKQTWTQVMEGKKSRRILFHTFTKIKLQRPKLLFKTDVWIWYKWRRDCPYLEWKIKVDNWANRKVHQNLRPSLLPHRWCTVTPIHFVYVIRVSVKKILK